MFEEVTIGNCRLILGDCREVLPTLGRIDAVVTDPPYGLRFMGKRWDYDAPDSDLWALVLDILSPGGHLLAFAGTRTQHRMAVRIEDAGFEIRDMLAWVYGSGFPKSLDVGKAIDKAAGAPATEAARQWQGWGTALKPALETITLARKPLVGTVAHNVQEHGTGALNIDGCRIAGEPWKAHSATGLASVKFFSKGNTPVIEKAPHDGGRWPANLIHDGSDEVVALFPQTGPSSATGGSVARFFYCSKVSASERGAGNDHPTVKPLALMRWLLTLVTPPGGVVLDPFLGSGSTGVAAADLGARFIGIEMDRKYFDIACERIAKAYDKMEQDLI